MDFWLSYATLASIYVLLGLSTNLLVGIAGIFSVSQAAVFGVGAYTVAYLLMNDLTSFLPAMLLASALCVALNILVTLPALRVSGDYFVVTSFGIQLLATAIFTNWTEGTGGANGLPGIPSADLFGKTLETSGEIVMLSFIAMVLGCLAFWLIMRAPFGRLLRAIREDELAVAAAGKNVLRAKVSGSARIGEVA
jgi:branched-chain amino acid transport system permease protein